MMIFNNNKEDKKGLNVLSLFDGMSCGRLALKDADIKVNKYFSSEIKEHAIQVADYNYPQDTKYRLGDVTKIKSSDLPRIDLLIGGSPCQDFSQANRERLGDKGTKSGLFYEYVRLLNELQPSFFLLENVKMKKEHEAIISKELGVQPIKINSKLVSPQLRDRLYWTNIPFNTLLDDKKISLQSILEDGYTDRLKARCLLESDSRPLSTPIKMCHRYFNTGFTTLIFKNKKHYESIKHHFDKHFKGKSALEIDSLLPFVDVSLYEGVRYLTKVERLRCQTLPDNYIPDSISDNDAACLLGDGWTVNVISILLRGIIQNASI